MKDLDAFIKKKQKFIKIKDGESYIGIYKGYSFVADPFNPQGDEKVAYRFQDPEDNVVRSWSTGRADVANDLKAVPLEARVRIARTGATPKDTKYKIEQLPPF